MKVYVVEGDDDEVTWICGVYDSEKKAIKAIKEFEKDYEGHFGIMFLIQPWEVQ